MRKRFYDCLILDITKPRSIDEFVDWHCSEPRLSFSKAVMIRYRMHLGYTQHYRAPAGVARRGSRPPSGLLRSKASAQTALTADRFGR